MRTTLTLDEDVAAKLREVSRRSGKSFKQTVNELLRLALNTKADQSAKSTFGVRVRDLGELLPGVSLDNIAELLDRTEGPEQR